ncbi:thiol:disulfide interchange protein DsbA/DsbL [Pseudoxanthomonas winnipegensis]|jgi:thiol:disulfide interchange protein DsbA|uniref:Thiol:disulfide interchange protein n=1 Tax=Pseudoxanthomonas winnipegensis TaxID=2480810 RepID=A0A4Q9TFQ0_9GAMM|nr:thiol:disulfide interchange protein DsbA/DsbL [Pseudoxanthomonas winnipegensis]RZZ81335.1 thiol:disulfide interchange protein DsbA/DsbL [Pseudoxanthomonas winnipegensis]TAA06765.1 thiol:disulfide interchange protein DsbA/DsbL [Pseudoxanthomonas winnipegensis]TAA16391.1 thiol:disulfide interchange protein DsbA/DsbL [Pseudoxanthomonas winnipegensis]TAA24201.1 thiol:disulfide interchange protein DsbA/DsbL [Pseudoxanthomonas winnipegensis]TAA36885.1 thiol:disulfide interchange protein DsbA/DsbL
MKLRLFALALLALLPLTACASSNAPVEGEDYDVIAGGQPFAPLTGQQKVEVVEVFGYVCIHCAHFEPQFEAWQKRQPASVRVTSVPAAFGGYWIPYAKAFYAAQQLGVLKQSHAAVFKALHDSHELPIQNASDQEIAGFYARFGPDPDKFAAAMESPQVAAQLDKARAFGMASGIRGTPTLVINGKYRITTVDPDDVLKVADFLIKRELAAAK